MTTPQQYRTSPGLASGRAFPAAPRAMAANGSLAGRKGTLLEGGNHLHDQPELAGELQPLHDPWLMAVGPR